MNYKATASRRLIRGNTRDVRYVHVEEADSRDCEISNKQLWTLLIDMQSEWFGSLYFILGNRGMIKDEKHSW